MGPSNVDTGELVAVATVEDADGTPADSSNLIATQRELDSDEGIVVSQRTKKLGARGYILDGDRLLVVSSSSEPARVGVNVDFDGACPNPLVHLDDLLVGLRVPYACGVKIAAHYPT